MGFTTKQQEAIYHNDGHLKIIACAGSGKTTVMAERIARLIYEGADRDKIVAFTFTEKAAASLKFRIREKLQKWCPGSSHLGGMYIGTIHSFAFQKLKEIKPVYRNYEILDEMRRIIWVQKNRSDIGFDSLKRREAYFNRIQRFLNSVDIIRDNEIPLDSLDSIPEFKQVYKNYLDLLENDNYLDFTGIICKLVNTLENEQDALDDIRKSVDNLIVDEYQDVNNIQEKLISLIAGEGANLCVVGDDDQSIFEFQGAEVDNIINFENRYNGVREVKLESNFRCPKEVIDASKDFIKRNKYRISKDMEAGLIDGSVKRAEDGDLCKLEFDTIEEEASFVVDKINYLIGCEYNDDGELRGLDYGDMAVIVRNKTSAQRFINSFREAGIPFTFKGTGGLFERPEIEFTRLIFCYLAGQSSRNTVNPDETPVTLDDLKESFEDSEMNHISWEQLVERLNNLKKHIESIPNNRERRIFLQDFYYEFMINLEVNENNFSREILYDFGRLSKLISDFEAVHGWITYNTFKQFIIFLNGYAMMNTDEGGIDDPRNTNSVNILTVHGAKGLEFPAVFIPDLSTRRFPSQMRTRKPKTHLENLDGNILDLSKYTSEDEGERRLFYVAATRTKKFLFITRSDESMTGNRANRSSYFREFDHDSITIDEIRDPTERNRTEPKCKEDMELMPTSFSDLKHYRICPYSYLLQQMMGFTPSVNLAFGYGEQIHNILNYLNNKWDRPPERKEIEDLVESNFFLRYTTGEPYENMKNKAKEVISTYYEEYGKSEFEYILETEKPFEFISEDALISGDIDLIQKIDPSSGDIKDVSILDFKTEKEEQETKRLNRFQLRLYAIGSNKSLGLNTKEAGIHYLTENHREDNVDISEEMLEKTEQEISDIIKNIKKDNFSPNPKKKKCEECDVKYVCIHCKAEI